MKTVAEVMYEQGMFQTTTRKGSIAEARVAIMEKRVLLDGRLVTHTEVKFPVDSSIHEIKLKKWGGQQEEWITCMVSGIYAQGLDHAQG